MNCIQLLDCTLRDGAYVVEADFGSTAIRGIIDKLEKADVEIIECGWLKNNEHKNGTSFYHSPSDLKQYIEEKKKDKIYVVMVDWNRFDVSNLPENDGRSIDAIRIAFPSDKYNEAIEMGCKIKEKGYRIYFQAMNSLAYSDEELISLAKEINKINPDELSVADTFGAMYEEDLERIIKILDNNLNPEIKLGFHSHNNLQLAYALVMHFLKIMENSNRNIVIDSSLCGMGRGAGNATTELVASYLNKKYNKNYNIDEIMDAIDKYIIHFQNNYSWGYSTQTFISGFYCSHINNVSYLKEKYYISNKELRNIIKSLSTEKKQNYDFDLLDSKYADNQKE